jgi:hypothetical protein
MITDVNINGRVVRLFNTHILLHIEPVSPLKKYFYKAISTRFKDRQLAFNNLKEDIATTDTDYIIAGDFNSTKAMGVMDEFLATHIDAVNYSRDLIPLTFEFSGLRFWRFDYVMVPKKSKNIIIQSLRNLYHENLSDHYSQYIIFDIRKTYL